MALYEKLLMVLDDPAFPPKEEQLGPWPHGDIHWLANQNRPDLEARIFGEIMRMCSGLQNGHHLLYYELGQIKSMATAVMSGTISDFCLLISSLDFEMFSTVEELQEFLAKVSDPTRFAYLNDIDGIHAWSITIVPERRDDSSHIYFRCDPMPLS